MRTTKRGTKLAALALGFALVAAACGSDDDGDTTEGTTGDTTATEETTADTDATEDTTGDTTPPAAEAAMVVTYDINPDAVWDDGSPITAADFTCTWQANLNTPASLSTAGYDQIISVEAGESDKQAVVTFSTTYAPWKGLFNLIKADAFEDCNDVSTGFDGGIPFSGGPMKIDSWSDEQLVMVPNEAYYGTPAVAEKVVFVPAEDGPTALKAGTVDFIYPQFFAGLEDELADPNVVVSRAAGGDYEGLYFQVKDGPFADPVYRQAFSQSIDRDALFAQIYAPFAGDQGLLNCGPIVPGNSATMPSPVSTTRLRPRRCSRRQAGPRVATASGPTPTATCPRCVGWSTPATPAVRAPRTT